MGNGLCGIFDNIKAKYLELNMRYNVLQRNVETG